MSLLLSPLPNLFTYAVALVGDEPRLRAHGSMSNVGLTPPPDERQLEDARLLRCVALGDKAAFAELYDRFSGPLYATALRVIRDATEAQDIVHDAFVTMWSKAATFDVSRGNAFTWAVTLVRNRAIDRVRSRRRRAELLANAPPADLGYATDEHAVTGSDALTQSEDARMVRAAVATLPGEQRRALELAFFGGLTQEQIAAQLREPLGTVKARIRRGLLKLRESLARRP